MKDFNRVQVLDLPFVDTALLARREREIVNRGAPFDLNCPYFQDLCGFYLSAQVKCRADCDRCKLNGR